MEFLYPKYSFLMCVYIRDNKTYLLEAIESMVSQTIKPFEIVIVCDGPLSIELDKIITDYQNKYSDLFQIIRSPTNVGFANALNLGIINTRTQYIARMDSDDISFPNRIECELQQLINNPDISIVGSYVLEFNLNKKDAKFIRNVPINHNDIFKVSKTRSPFNHPSVIIRKNDLIDVGMYRDIKRKEDLDLFGRMMIKGYKGVNLAFPLLFYRSDKNNYLRKKNIYNLINYIKVIYYFYRLKHSTFFDLITVLVYQISFFIFPVSLLKIITNSFYRKKINYE
jgi:glycosyltransferase involved in cell wall biosynthesis